MDWQFMGSAMGHGGMVAFMRAMFSGMAVLIVPPFAICCGISWMAWKRRDRFAEKP